MNRNESIIMEMMKKIKLKVCESTCHEYPSNYEVESYKQYNDVYKEEIVMKVWYEK